MSLRILAQKHLSELAGLSLSHRDTPKGCPSGTNNSLAISDGTIEVVGTVGTSGTGGTEQNKTKLSKQRHIGLTAERQRLV